MSSFKTFMNKNGSTIATTGSIVLTIAAVWLAIKKAKEGAEAKEEYDEEFEKAEGNAQLETEAKVNYIKKTVRIYRDSIIAGLIAITCAYISHRTDAKRIANLGAALALNEEKLNKVYKYLERKLEPGKSKKTIEKDILESDPEAGLEGTSKVKKRYRKEEPVTFQDSYSGTRFESTMKDYDAACDRAELILSRRSGFGLGYNKWRSLLGLEDVPCGAETGWKQGEFRSYLQESMIDCQKIYLICYKEFPNSQYWK